MLSCGHINARSLLNNFNIFKDHLNEFKYDILGVSETWLHAGIADNTLSFGDYIFVRQDRPSRAGGVGVYFKNSLDFKVVLQECNAFMEHIWVEIKVGKKSLIVGNVYRPPSSDMDDFVSGLEDILADFYTKFDCIILMGDFNVNMLNFDSKNTNLLINLTESFDLRQVISEPTRITMAGYSLIDLIFSNVDVKQSGTRDVVISDHLLVYCDIDFGVTECHVYNFTYRQLDNINKEQFFRDIESLPWHLMYRMAEIDSKVDFFTDAILQVINTHAPLKKVTGKTRPYQPWITPNIRLMQSLRNKALNKFKETKKSEHWIYYKQLRNLTTSAIRSEKKAYLNYKFSNCSQKQKWQELKKTNIYSKTVYNLPENLKNVNDINKYFIDVSKSINAPDEGILSFYNTNRLVSDNFSFQLASENEIINILGTIKTKVFGLDQLNITLLLLCCPFILQPLTHIINVCLEKSYFPKKWKQAKVIPLPKVKCPTDFGQLRSISILPTLSKVLEKIMEKQIITYLNKNSIIPNVQSGFRTGYSCCTALSKVTDDIIGGLDDNKASILILLDYTKAFDMLNHKILLSILNYIGFNNAALKLISSFVSNRIQSVVIDEKSSNALEIQSGVPQGSILGPLLYTIYTSQFQKCLSYCTSHMYADDTQIYLTFTPSSVELANYHINFDLNKLLNESKKHLLKINPSKSVAILFSGDHNREHILANIDINLDGNSINFKNSAKNLGVLMDHKLRFKEHINSKLKIGYSALKMIYSHRHYLSQNTKKMLCEALVLSPLNYCDSIYGPCLDALDSRRIQKLQNSCMRLIFGIRRREHISHKLKELKWLNMYNRRKLHAICFFYKVLKFKSPPYLLDRVVFRTDVHNVNVRRKNIINIPRHKKQLFKRSFSYCLASYLNQINVTDFSLSCLSFKNKIKAILFNQQ